MTTYPTPVPKPLAAGSSRPAIALTRMAYANVRSGPGTRYRTVGDLRHHSLIARFPATRTGDGWEWIEHVNIAGWVSTNVVTFEDTANSAEKPASPFDDQMALWHERGDSLPDNDLETYVASLKRHVPNLNQVWVKVCDWSAGMGAQWMGAWDTNRALAIDSVDSIDHWAAALTDVGLSMCVWTPPRGGSAEAEADLIALACERRHVRALILDLQVRGSRWGDNPRWIDSYMTTLREQLPKGFHIGISFDATRTLSARLHVERWLQFADSIHPKIFPSRARRTPTQALQAAFVQFDASKKPIIPCLAGDAELLEIAETGILSVYRHGARGLSWWRSGLIHEGGWSAIRRLKFNRVVSKLNSPPPVSYGDEIVVTLADAGAMLVASGMKKQTRLYDTTPVLSVNSDERVASTHVMWTPMLSVSGTYEIAAFIPTRGASAQHAQYHIRVDNGEVLASVDQTDGRASWVTLAVVALDAAVRSDGAVKLSSLTGNANERVAFSAIRWRQIVEGSPTHRGDGYDMPIGSAAERKARKVWGDRWTDTSPFGKLHFVGTHDEAFSSGADLSLVKPSQESVMVHAAANGVVIFVGRLPIWGNIIVIRHYPIAVDGQVIYGRYARAASMTVKMGQAVTRGEPIGTINAEGELSTLHFDLSPTAILATHPGHWARRDRDGVFKHYLDPREFIEANRPI